MDSRSFAVLAETKREIIAAAQPKGGGTGANQHQAKEQPGQNFAPAAKDERRTNAEIGKASGVSRETVRKYRRIKALGDHRLIDGLRTDFSMDNAYHMALGKAPARKE